MYWMFLPLRRFLDFRGRSRRKEFWMFVLLLVLAHIPLAIIDSWLGFGGLNDGYRHAGVYEYSFSYRSSGGLFTALFGVIMFIPSLAVSVRRLHDVDKSGWWLLIALVPLIGGLFLLFHYVQPGTRGPNRFGTDPLDEGSGAQS